jgi:hypothetical protein
MGKECKSVSQKGLDALGVAWEVPKESSVDRRGIGPESRRVAGGYRHTVGRDIGQ